MYLNAWKWHAGYIACNPLLPMLMCTDYGKQCGVKKWEKRGLVEEELVLIDVEEKEKPRNKFTQGFVKQANLTCSLTRCREYDRKKCVAISMLEREENLNRRMEHDRVRRPMKIGEKGLVCWSTYLYSGKIWRGGGGIWRIWRIVHDLSN